MQSSDDEDDRTVIRPSAAPVAAAPAAAASAPTFSSAGGALPVGTRLGEFELTSLLGEGGFGIVYLAWDHSLERRVALKEYMPSALAMRGGGTQVQVKSERHRDTFEAGRKSFVNEARLLAQFDHPSLVKVYRFWEANGTAYMVMPFYEGSTLKAVLADLDGPPDEAWLLALLAPLTEALAVLHSANCFHRDIAPDNVLLLADSGRPLLLDFGAARRVIGDMTQALTVILKPGYAPVEQYADAPGMKQGPWTDIYALAASVYYAILGKTPPPSVSRLMSDAYVPLTQSCAGRYSERFLSAIDRALNVRPEDRTASVEALREDLGLGATSRADAEPADADTTVLRSRAASPPGATAAAAAIVAEVPVGTPSRRVGLLAGAGTAALLAAGLAWWVWRPASPQPASASRVASAPAVVEPASTAAPPLTTASAPTPVAATEGPAPPPVATMPAAASFNVPAEFDQVMARQTPGHGVKIVQSPERLRADKDLLRFSLQSEQDGEVSVLVLGPDGSLVRLLPAGAGERISVRAGQTLQLPPKGVSIPVSEPLGLEQLLIIVSATPRRWEAMGGKFQDGYLNLPVGAEAARRQAERGAAAGPYLLGDPSGNCQGPRCFEYGAARLQFEVVR